MSLYEQWVDPPCQPEAAKHGHFKQKRPGNCRPCLGWGFELEENLWQVLVERGAAASILTGERYIRCRQCKGRGNVRGGRRS